MNNEPSQTHDQSPESIGTSRFLIIMTGSYYQRDMSRPLGDNQNLGIHPLSDGFPPAWAYGWGQDGRYGIFVDYQSLKFLYHPYGFWFCEVPAEGKYLSTEEMAKMGAVYFTDEAQRQRIQEFYGYKNWKANPDNPVYSSQPLSSQPINTQSNVSAEIPPDHDKPLLVKEEVREKIKMAKK